MIHNKPFIKVLTLVDDKKIRTPGFINSSFVSGSRVTPGNPFIMDIYLGNHIVSFKTQFISVIENVMVALHTNILTNLSMPDRYTGLGFIIKPEGVIAKAVRLKGKEEVAVRNAYNTDIIHLEDVTFWDFEINKNFTIYNIFFDIKGGIRITWIFNSQEEQSEVLGLLYPYCKEFLAKFNITEREGE